MEGHIISMNIDRKLSSLIQLSEITTQHHPAIVCIQDMYNENTEDKQEAMNRLFPGYIQQTAGQPRARLKTLTCTQRTVNLHTNSYCDENIITILITRSKIADSQIINTANIYIRPKSSALAVIKALDWIEQNVQHISQTLLVGDFNAISHIWDNEYANRLIMKALTPYDKKKIEKGKIIENWMGKKNLMCLNEDTRAPTYSAEDGHTSTIDLAIVGSKTRRKWSELRVLDMTRVGHKPLLITSVGQNKMMTTRKVKYLPNKQLIRESDIETIKLTINPLCKGWDSLARDQIITKLNNIVDNLCEQIKYIQTRITKPKNTNKQMRHRRERVKSTLIKTRTQHIILKIRNIERKRTRAERPKVKRRLQKEKNKLRKRLINKILREQYRDIKNTDLWQRARTILSADTTNSSINLDIKTKNDIEKIAKEKFPAMKKNINVRGTYPAHQMDTLSITQHESNRAIHNLRSKKYNSPEGIRMDIFHAIISKTPDIMHTIARMSFATCTVPKKAEYTTGTIIPKKASGQFRIVHVPSSIAAFLETIALGRLDYLLERDKLISGNQYGFTALRSRHDLVARVIERALRNKKQGRATCIVSIDIEGAFDNVDQEYLIRKLYRELQQPALAMWIASFLENRKISIRYGELKSQYRQVCRGVPQGSALGPILWNFAIHDIDKHISTRKTMLLKYADDIYILTDGSDLKNTQQTINDFVTAIRNIKLNVRAEKCSYIKLFEENTALQINEHLIIEGKEIARSETMNILGICLTSKCQLDKINKEATTKLSKLVQSLNKLKRTKLINSNKEWRILIDSLIVSRTIGNNWPAILANKVDAKWTNELLLRIIKNIMGWSESTSNKLVKLILDINEAGIMARKLAKDRLHLESGKSYSYLLKQTSMEGNVVKRRYGNPEKMPTIMELGEARHNLLYVLEGKHFAGLIRIRDGRIEPHILHSAWHSPGPYTNTLVTLMVAADRNELSGAEILANGNCSIVQALKNMNNHDYRIIELREKLSDLGCRINTVVDEEHERIKEEVKRHIRMIGVRAEAGDTANNFDEWTRSNEMQNSNRHSNDKLTSTAINKPDTCDYMMRLLAKKEFMTYKIIERRSNMNATCKKIECGIEKWLRVNPTYLDGKDMLMLSGLIKDSQSGRVRKDKTTNECSYCKKGKDDMAHRRSNCDKFTYTKKTRLIKEIKQLSKIALLEH